MELSGTYLYVRARQLEGTYPGNPEEGAWAVNSLRILAGCGVPLDEEWPRRPSLENWPPREPPGMDEKAKPNRIHRYQRVRTAEQCYRALCRPLPVGVSVGITEQWFDAPGGRIELPATPQQIIGAHHFAILGYSREKQGFEFQNSWGRGWGDNGFGVLPVDYFDEYLVEAWTNDALGVIPTPHHFGTEVLRWRRPDCVYENATQYGAEIRDTSRDERIGWTFAVVRDGYLDVEELFVRPQYRRQGYGRQLAGLLRELSWHVGRNLRLWVPFADYAPGNFPGLIAIAQTLGVELKESGVRWAALKGEACGATSQLFVPPPAASGSAGTIQIPQVAVPKRPAMARPGALESAVAQPQMTFGGQELYPSLAEKAGALAFSPVTNHPFVDGNKRVGHAAMAVFLKANGNELTGSIDDHEAVFLALACGTLSRRDLAQWIKDHMQEVRP
jgi:death-on-curing protein